MYREERERAQAQGQLSLNPNLKTKMSKMTKTTTTATSAAAARGARAAPGTMGTPPQAPCTIPSQRASQPAPRGRAISASKRGRVHRR